ncbi:MAG TPA: response regulator [Xanthobacteraceae bacterium]|nr:response regulator [Xanthobacteraceae bacterium]
MRILLIDDSEDSRDLTEAALLSAGYTDIATAASGWEALKILDVGGTSEERAPVDVVLLDIVMPEMDGVECCARIRNDARYADLPVLMVTALDDMDSLANAFVAGATDYITKPVNRVELVARVRAALRLKQELDRRQARERELLSFVSNWGDRRATTLIDETTGLFAGEAAEAYLTAACGGENGTTVSILALSLDRFDVYRTTNGDGAARKLLAQVARAVRRLGASVGIIAAAYRNGTILLVAPELEAAPARDLGETLRTTVAKLRVPNSEAVAADHVTASVAAITGRVKQAVDRVRLLTQAISGVQNAAGAGGNRVLAMSI